MRCGWCQGTGTYQAKTCVCSQGKRGYFPGKGKTKKKDDTLKSGHKHGNDKFLHETATSMWFECNCGHTHKVTL